MTAQPSPAEIVELTGNSGRVPGKPVELTPVGMGDIIESHPVPRKQLEIVLRIKPDAEPGCVALGAARFVSAVQGADRWLKLALDAVQSRASDGDVLLVFKPAQLGVLVADRLEKVAAAAREAVAAFTGRDALAGRGHAAGSDCEVRRRVGSDSRRPTLSCRPAGATENSPG
jgi:hypothetical protein